MDVNAPEQPLKKLSVEETSRKPLAPAARNDGGTRRSQTREVSSRYMSPAPSTPRRFPSPSTNRTTNATSQMVPKRATTAERKRPSTPLSPKRPSTPVQDTSVDIHMASRKESGNRMPELLWPSTMRSLSVSFQSDYISAPFTKKEKPVSPSLSNRALRPSSNVTQKTPVTLRRPTPERKGTLLKGNHSENSIPGDGLDARLVGQHGWPSSTGGKKSSSTLARTAKPSVPLNLGTRPSCIPKDDFRRDLQRSASDTASLVSFENLESLERDARSVNDNPLQGSKLQMSSHSVKQLRPVTPASPKKKALPAQSFPRGLSPSRPRIPTPTPSRGVSPTRIPSRGFNQTPIPSRGVSPTPVPSRGVSPSRIRPSSPSRQESTSSTTSVLTFTPYIKKGKNISNHLEDVHQLRLLYNRHLQWRYANAQSDATLQRQKTKVEKTLYNMSNAMVELWVSVIQKRTELQQLRMKLDLYSILKEQIVFLDEWASIERNHTCSLSWAIEDLESSILRVPFTAGARGQTETVNAAIYSALNVIQSMGSSIYSTLRVDGVTSLVAELANVATQERLMLDECGALLTSIAAMQVEEYSLRTHLIQLKESLKEAG
ncbi:AUGMIN subunit 8-like [Impatiens glandulifera]|uniref:AUGMIN subunit 8-like n=1 Tax=Impatiens glandulifera TaxID=253017 RepID=UPI001FB1783B|nr:AUGMIN subunit 8-like [Impatiens glandulifera]XP_047308984.1 AUGMIN subunit 8-like [Impatiens glandulifera]XP_047308985.1 AUGMIN subunit 8-like [Impatiens glandulifera]